MTFEDALRGVRLMTRTWPGEVIDSAETLRVLPGGDPARSLVWIFNAEHEPAALAGALGDGFRLHVGRSLNLVMPRGPARDPLAAQLGAHYARVLASQLTAPPVLVGGNCQAAPIALSVARHLADAGLSPRAMACIDWRFDAPVPWPLLSIRGSSFSREAPETGPGAAGSEIAYVDHLHGTYFEPETVPDIAAHLERFIAARADRPGVIARLLRRVGIQA